MQSFTVDLTLGISAMTVESAENKLDTFLSALDLKKNDKMELLELGELAIETDEPNEDEWDDDWANEDWDTIDEEPEVKGDELDDDTSSDPAPEVTDELAKLLSEINAAKEVAEEAEAEENLEIDFPVNLEVDDEEDWGNWDDDWE